MYFLHLTGKYRFIIMLISVVKRILQYMKTLPMDSEMGEREWLEIKKARNNFLASCLLFL
ncbi:hypothetical protein AAW12_07045 [Sphingobacterium sp. Ag1]|nr:hypothetical protein AAW12_07045 [Sphingobacterium sp. Ag1]